MTGPLVPVGILNLIRASLGIPPDSTFPENALALDLRKAAVAGDGLQFFGGPSAPLGAAGSPYATRGLRGPTPRCESVARNANLWAGDAPRQNRGLKSVFGKSRAKN